MKILIILFVATIIVSVAAFQKPGPVKTYSVTLTQAEWVSRFQTIQNVKQIMRQSTVPSNTVSAWSDSLDVFAAEIQKQVSSQVQVEQKTDSIKPKPKAP